MVRIFAGYTIEQNELVDFLVKEGWGPEHGKPDFTANEVWMAFVSWRSAQPREGDPETLYPWPQYWYNKNGDLVYAFMTRRSGDLSDLKLRFQEKQIDIDIRDRFVKKAGLNPNKLKFWSLPEYVLQFPTEICF